MVSSFPPTRSTRLRLAQRIKRIIVFNPLDKAAMIGICRKMVAQTQSLWQRKREKRIAVPEVLIEFVGRRAHELNEKSGGKEGGRIVRKLITDLIESRIQNEADRRPEEYKQCAAIRLELESIRNGDEESRAIPRFRIEFGC